MHPRSATLMLVAMLSLVTPLHAGEPRRAFLLMHGADTLAVEQIERTHGRLAGTVLFRPAGMRIDYSAALTEAGTIAHMTTEVRRASDAPDAKPQQSATLDFEGDSVFVTLASGRQQRLVTRAGAVPFLNPSIAFPELLGRLARPEVGATRAAAFFAVSGGQTFDATVARPSADSVAVSFAGVSFRFAVDRDGDVTGGRVPEQGLTVVAVATLPPGLLVMPQPDYSAPADAPYTATEVSVPTRGGFALAGTLTLPRHARRAVPCAITITGSGAEDRDESIPLVRGYRPFRQIADALARRGIAVLRLDDRGVGHSSGSFAGSTTRDFSYDIEDALAWLRKRDGIDPARLALIGHSEGGAIAPLVAAGDPRLRAIVLLAGPAYPGRRVIEYQQRDALAGLGLAPASLDSALRVAAVELDSTIAHDAWMRMFAGYDPIPTARQVRTSALVFQGATDHQVTAEQAGLLADAMRAGGDRDVTVHVWPETNHLFLHDPDGSPARYMDLTEHDIRPAILDEMTEWLVKRLGR